eukprot:scaffold886_cov249-Pinguiococcus_pyrenoidosus.AAC.11
MHSRCASLRRKRVKLASLLYVSRWIGAVWKERDPVACVQGSGKAGWTRSGTSRRLDALRGRPQLHARRSFMHDAQRQS